MVATRLQELLVMGIALLCVIQMGYDPVYFQNDEIIAAASERVALMTIFNQKATDIKELALVLH